MLMAQGVESRKASRLYPTEFKDVISGVEIAQRRRKLGGLEEQDGDAEENRGRGVLRGKGQTVTSGVPRGLKC